MQAGFMPTQWQHENQLALVALSKADGQCLVDFAFLLRPDYESQHGLCPVPNKSGTPAGREQQARFDRQSGGGGQLISVVQGEVLSEFFDAQHRPLHVWVVMSIHTSHQLPSS